MTHSNGRIIRILHDKFKPVQDKSFKRSATRLPKYNCYTPLNIIRACLLDEAFNAEILSLPPPTRLVNSTNKSKQSFSNHNYGHTTEECVFLKNKIEELVKEKSLNNYIDSPNNNRGGYKSGQE